MNKRQRKKNHKTFRTKEILKKSLAIANIITQSYLNAAKMLARGEHPIVIESVLEASKMQAYAIMATPIKPSKYKGDIITPNTGNKEMSS